MGRVEQPVGLAVMAKAPRAGAVKTRLCPPLRPPEAAELARCFLLDTVDRVGAVAGARPVIAYAPLEARIEFEGLAPGFALLAQQGEDLGARQSRLLGEVLALGHEAALVMGTDVPTLLRECLDEAVSLVMAPDVDLVLGPTDDGGYYLVGLRVPCPALFDDMPWSTSAVPVSLASAPLPTGAALDATLTGGTQRVQVRSAPAYAVTPAGTNKFFAASTGRSSAASTTAN